MADYNFVIVGTGFAGAIAALELGTAGYSVLLIEAGPGLVPSREDYIENFFLHGFKSPGSPYPPNITGFSPENTNSPRATVPDYVINWGNDAATYLTYTPGSLPFASTYEKLAGGTSNHWMGSVPRFSDSDFKLKTLYGVGRDWPISYEDLSPYYDLAEAAIGVSGDVADWEAIGVQFTPGYQYPMAPIAQSYSDTVLTQGFTGIAITTDDPRTAIVTPTPAGRNSEPYQGRRVCHGNTSCVPICPIGAKYDATVSLNQALATGNVSIAAKSVVDYVLVDATSEIVGVHVLEYSSTSVPAESGLTGEKTYTADYGYILAAGAIENAKILLNSNRVPENAGRNVANSSDQVGRNLMDHPTALSWGLTPEPVYGFRGPLSTSGIDNLRDGPYRSNRAAFRVEIGNEGWNWPKVEPYTSGIDFLYATDSSGLNAAGAIYSNTDLVQAVNSTLTRQFRLGMSVEQDAEPTNRVELSPTFTDNLGIPRPLVTYDLSDYTKRGILAGLEAGTNLIASVGGTEFTEQYSYFSTTFEFLGSFYNYSGAGHLCGTHLMGDDPADSVVDSYQKAHDHGNLWIVGCGSMPSVGTANPTITMLAMTYRTIDQLRSSFPLPK